MSDIRATLRQKFEPLFPVPLHFVYDEELGLYRIADGKRWHGCGEEWKVYNALWKGFQACHPIAYADAVRDCAEVCERIKNAYNATPLGRNRADGAAECKAEIKSLAP